MYSLTSFVIILYIGYTAEYSAEQWKTSWQAYWPTRRPGPCNVYPVLSVNAVADVCPCISEEVMLKIFIAFQQQKMYVPISVVIEECFLK
jgi:hypothetical protein